MRRSPADSTNRSLAAFGKLQHIPVAVLAGGTTTVAPRARAVSSMATVSEAASAVTRTRGPSTAMSRSRAVVASSPVAPVSVWTRITPD